MVITSVSGQPVESRFCFIAFLTFAACYPEKKKSDEKKQTWERLEKEYEQMKRWSDHCPVNFLHLSLLMEGVIAMLSEEPLRTAGLYDQAVEAAQENEWLCDEALGNELAADFWLNMGHRKIARTYLKDAYYLYFRWGSVAKADQLEEKHPRLLAGTNHETQSSHEMTVTSGSDTVTNSRYLDLDMVMKSSRSISGEIKLETLFEQLMKNIVESAGAQKGMLILKKKGKFYIEAEKTTDGYENAGNERRGGHHENQREQRTCQYSCYRSYRIFHERR
ncbi:MAG: hypothetical protein GY749_14295 [Desulfobacteraceae bacterium]|nr:hypothetical protein [Desulfobacteraceae bacterium]